MRLGAVPYLNAVPLIRYLPRAPRLAVPAALDRLLKLDELDLATAPIVTLFENPSYQLVPGIGIGTRGSAKSVRLIFNKPGLTLSDAESIYLDMESKTSAILLKILLRCKYNRDLTKIQFIHPLPTPEADAALVIGDKAMRNPPSKGSSSLDLGEEWTKWTGLPFVFAGWVGRVATLPNEWIKILQESRNRSLQKMEEWIGEVPFLSKEEARSYFTENISYRLGEEEIEGLRRFHAYGRELGFWKDEFRLSFYPV